VELLYRPKDKEELFNLCHASAQMLYDPNELADYVEDSVDEQPGTWISDGELACGPPNNQSRERASA